jgi:hypothetical protein
MLSFFLLMKAEAQQGGSKKTDVLSAKVIGLLKNNQADSIYAMTGKAFREKITAENFNSILTGKIFPATKFESVEFISSKEGINKYRIKATPPLQLLLGFDSDDKIQVFSIQEYVPD